jgi:DNA-directed RNA polymerase subunit K/omega
MSDIEDDYSVSVGDGDHDNDSDGEHENYKKPTSLGKKKPTLSDDEDDEDNGENGEDGEDEIKNEDIEILADEENDDDVEIEDDDEDEDEDEDDDEIEDDDDDDNDLYGGGDEDDEDDGENKSSKLGGAKGKSEKNKAKQEKKQTTIQLDNDIGNNDDYEDDDEDYQDENYLQKFDKEITKDYILDFHPECLSHNYDEIKALSRVTRDEFNIIIDPLHKTVPFLTKYERTRILGQRAKQIECGAKPLVKIPENIIDSYIIAELELDQKTIPFIIRRPIPSGGSEYWNLKDLEVISF